MKMSAAHRDLPGRVLLRGLLTERNQHPERIEEIDAKIRSHFERDLTVLMLDMVGFSRISRKLGIISFLAMIAEMYMAARPAVVGNGGRVIKLEADNLFAVFDNPTQALEAALDIFEGVRRDQRRRTRRTRHLRLHRNRPRADSRHRRGGYLRLRGESGVEARRRRGRQVGDLADRGGFRRLEAGSLPFRRLPRGHRRSPSRLLPVPGLPRSGRERIRSLPTPEPATRMRLGSSLLHTWSTRTMFSNRPRFQAQPSAWPRPPGPGPGLGQPRTVLRRRARRRSCKSKTVTLDQVKMDRLPRARQARRQDRDLPRRATRPVSSKFVTGRLVLDPGKTPHPPHTHVEEEVMVIEQGHGEIDWTARSPRSDPARSCTPRRTSPTGSSTPATRRSSSISSSGRARTASDDRRSMNDTEQSNIDHRSSTIRIIPGSCPSAGPRPSSRRGRRSGPRP